MEFIFGLLLGLLTGWGVTATVKNIQLRACESALLAGLNQAKRTLEMLEEINRIAARLMTQTSSKGEQP